MAQKYIYAKYRLSSVETYVEVLKSTTSASKSSSNTSRGYASYTFDKVTGLFEVVGSASNIVNAYNVATDKKSLILTKPGSYSNAEYTFTNYTYQGQLQTVDSAGAYIGSVSGVDGTYPNNGKHTDGFFYIKGNVVSNKYLFQDGEEIKKYVLESGEIPVMKGFTEGAVVVSGSSSIGANYLAWKAFDKDNTTGWVSGIMTSDITPQWIQIDIGKEVVVTKYAFTNSPVGVSSPHTQLQKFSFLGSIDGNNWITLDSRNGITWSASNERKEYLFVNSIPYRFYRLSIEKAIQITSHTYAAVGELEIGLNLLTIEKWVTVGTAPATKEMFDTHGMTDLSVIKNEAIQQLVSDTPELLCWTDEEGPEASKKATTPTNVKTTNGQINTFDINQQDYYHSIISIEKGSVS